MVKKMTNKNEMKHKIGYRPMGKWLWMNNELELICQYAILCFNLS